MTTQDLAHRLIDAVADRVITRDLAHAYLHADLKPDQLDAILEIHRNAPPYPFSPGHNPSRPVPAPMPYPGIPGAVPTMRKKDPILGPPWVVTCDPYPGQPLATATLQRLYPTNQHPAPYRPHKPWPGQQESV